MQEVYEKNENVEYVKQKKPRNDPDQMGRDEDQYEEDDFEDEKLSENTEDIDIDKELVQQFIDKDEAYEE